MAPSTLKIKVDALRRLMRERSLYEEKAAEQRNYVAQLKENNADDYEVKKQREVLSEYRRIRDELPKEINDHKEALTQFLETYEGDEDVEEAKDLIDFPLYLPDWYWEDIYEEEAEYYGTPDWNMEVTLYRGSEKLT